MLPFGTHFGTAPDALLLLFMALAVDAVFGEMGPLFRLLPHPVVLLGRMIAALDKRLNKPALPESDRRLRGVVLVVLMAALAAELRVPVEKVEAVGWDGDALEAQAFAYLAVRSLRGLPLTFPETTGVPQAMGGGRFHAGG